MSDSSIDSDELEDALVLHAIATVEEEEMKKKLWVHHIPASREVQGEFVTLFPQLKKDNVKFFQYFRMTYEKFSELLTLIETDITKQDTNYRRSIPAEELLRVRSQR